MNTGGTGGTVNSCRSSDTAGRSATVTYIDNTTQPPTTREEVYGELSKDEYDTFLAAYGKSNGTVDVTCDGTGAVTSVAAR